MHLSISRTNLSNRLRAATQSPSCKATACAIARLLYLAWIFSNSFCKAAIDFSLSCNRTSRHSHRYGEPSTHPHEPAICRLSPSDYLPFYTKNLYKYRLSFLKIQLIVGFSLFFSFYFHYFSLYNTQYVYLCHADEKDGKSLAIRCFYRVFYLKRVLLNHKILTIVNHSVRYNRYS